MIHQRHSEFFDISRDGGALASLHIELKKAIDDEDYHIPLFISSVLGQKKVNELNARVRDLADAFLYTDFKKVSDDLNFLRGILQQLKDVGEISYQHLYLHDSFVFSSDTIPELRPFPAPEMKGAFAGFPPMVSIEDHPTLKNVDWGVFTQAKEAVIANGKGGVVSLSPKLQQKTKSYDWKIKQSNIRIGLVLLAAVLLVASVPSMDPYWPVLAAAAVALYWARKEWRQRKKYVEKKRAEEKRALRRKRRAESGKK